MRRHLWICLALAIAGALSATAAERPTETKGIQLVPSPPPVAAKELMRRWHREYRGRISPVLKEWRSLALAARQRPGHRLTAGCRRLELALSEMGRGQIPVAPDPSISLHLEEALRSLSDAASSCTHGAHFLSAWRLREADDSWRQLRGRLLLYGLAP